MPLVDHMPINGFVRLYKPQRYIVLGAAITCFLTVSVLCALMAKAQSGGIPVDENGNLQYPSERVLQAAPLPPKRPASLSGSQEGQPVAAQPVNNEAPAVQEPQSYQGNFGTVFKPLDSKGFVPFSAPKSVPLRPKMEAKPASEKPESQPEQPVATTPPVEDTPEQSDNSAAQQLVNVPLPPPAPPNRDVLAEGVQNAAGNNDQPQTVGAAPGVAAVPPPADLPAASKLSDQQILDRANRFFNTLNTMQADFVQIGGDGKRMKGVLYLERPGRVRFSYNPPSAMEIISDGKNVAIKDGKLNTSDVYSINQTPLKFLLRDPINLGKDLKLVEIDRDPTSTQITLEDSTTIGGRAQIVLYFDTAVQNLSRWQIHDAQGFVTTVILSNIDRTRRGR
ncbi:outer-membrane lipoprotein carrier protein LolA [Microvirga sp. W0021]|uniref:Outer-membrane lipoprotein carrier protein LolA n=1 Tax=Hohaiivirga grylli TaxID=3133970 RepID=A0ABV0BIE7_9HYPH